jgi:hypothetical protein
MSEISGGDVATLQDHERETMASSGLEHGRRIANDDLDRPKLRYRFGRARLDGSRRTAGPEGLQ